MTTGPKFMRFVAAATLALFGAWHFPEAQSEDSVDGIVADIKREDAGLNAANTSSDSYEFITQSEQTTAARGPAWVFPDSSLRKLNESELCSLGAEELWRARNEIFARRGYVFGTEKGRGFADSLGEAYQPLSDDADRIYQSMNPVEKHNVKLIESLEKSGNISRSRWVIAAEAVDSRTAAQRASDQWKSRGFNSDILWIPDYLSLSGAKLWLAYIGPWNYEDRSTVRAVLSRVKRQYPEAYAIKLDQSGKRETFGQ